MVVWFLVHKCNIGNPMKKSFYSGFRDFYWWKECDNTTSGKY